MIGIGNPDPPTPSYRCAIERREKWCVVRLAGQIDMESSDRIRPLLDDLVGGQGLLDIEIDLSETTFIDSTGICLLLQTERVLLSSDGQLRVRGVPRSLSRLLEVLDLGDHFDLVDALDGEDRDPVGPVSQDLERIGSTTTAIG
jgi:anti-anti-sigma factor